MLQLADLISNDSSAINWGLQGALTSREGSFSRCKVVNSKDTRTLHGFKDTRESARCVHRPLLVTLWYPVGQAA